MHLDYSTSYRNDGNNVDIEKEMVDARENSMRYMAMAQRTSDKFRLLSIQLDNARDGFNALEGRVKGLFGNSLTNGLLP